MTAALAVWVSCTAMVAILLVVFIPRLGQIGMYKRPGVAPISGDQQGSVMDTIARWVVLSLGRITFAVLHFFEKLGVDMADVDQVLADWTAWSENIKTQLSAALADAQTLRDTDAAEDAAQANALSEALADKVQAAFDAVSAPPQSTPVDDGGTSTPEPGPTVPGVDPATDPNPVVTAPGEVTVTEPGPPETPPSADSPVAETPVVDPGDPANVPPESVPDPEPVVVTEPEAPADVPVEETPAPVEEGPVDVPSDEGVSGQ